MSQESTKRLHALLQKVSEEDLFTLMEYNFGKNCTKVSVDNLIKEIRYNGSHNIAYLFRGHEGVDYLEIVQDVARKLKVLYQKEDDEERIETMLMLKVLEDFRKKAKPEEKQAFEEFLKEQGFKDWDSQNILKYLLDKNAVGGIVNIFSIVASAVARQFLQKGLLIVANPVLRGAMFLGPVGIALNGLFIAHDLAGPAFRKTIPSVLHIAFLRQKAKLADFEMDEDN